MPTQIIAGRITTNGSVAGGSGFYLRALGAGQFIVEFDEPFETPPTVVVKQNYPGWDDSTAAGGDTRDNVVLGAVDRHGFKVLTGSNSGEAIDRNFAFIAAGASAQSTQPGMVWGTVNADGSIHSGSNFECVLPAVGTYIVDFDPPLAELSSIVVTQNYPDWDDPGHAGGSTLDNAVIVAANAGNVKYITGGSGGDKVSRNCSFVAVGTGGTAPQALLYGNVNADGTLFSGSGGFAVNTTDTGTYVISFTNAFAGTPAMLLTQNYPEWGNFTTRAVGDSRDNAVVVALNGREAKIITGDNSGTRVNRNFGFLVVG